MPSSASLLVFAGATLVLLAVPGPAVTYIVTRSVARGRRAGLLSVAGIHLGTLVHVLAAVAGLSAIIVRSASAFTVVKLAGAAYLVFLGLSTLLASRRPREGAAPVTLRSSRRVFVDGFVVNALNPKTAVFFLAFVPQFVDPARGSTTSQLLVLGGLFIGLGMITDGAYALGSAWVAGKVRPAAGARPWARWLSGSIYLGLGAATALGGRSTAQ